MVNVVGGCGSDSGYKRLRRCLGAILRHKIQTELQLRHFHATPIDPEKVPHSNTATLMIRSISP